MGIRVAIGLSWQWPATNPMQYAWDRLVSNGLLSLITPQYFEPVDFLYMLPGPEERRYEYTFLPFEWGLDTAADHQ
jgi:hypothetical protein